MTPLAQVARACAALEPDSATSDADATLPALVAPRVAPAQPPLAAPAPIVLHAAIASLAIGGAERIVLDWAAATVPRYRVRLLVLRTVAVEWPVPDGVELVRLAGSDPEAALRREGGRIAASGNPLVLCHLLRASERSVLASAGALPIPVVHNAEPGWIEGADALRDAPWLIAVSRAAAAELRAAGLQRVSVVHHLPARRRPDADARARWRARWAIPQDACVIGMVGGVKPQKAYPRALHVLAALAARRDVWLVVLGGPVGRDGGLAWLALLQQIERLGLAHRVRLPGFVRDAARAMPAFDVLLNTSRYEGLSIATLEALAAGLPAVAAAVGGQGEIAAPGLKLVPYDAPADLWADALEQALSTPAAPPAWLGFPAVRTWTLMHLPTAEVLRDSTLFVTANLNSGGAQRSLVNLATTLAGSCPFEIAVCGDSSSTAFHDELRAAGVRVTRTSASRDAFDHALALLRCAAAGGHGTIVFWNVDAKVKLLLAKRLAHGPVRLVDVSPGAYAHEEMEATHDFQTWIGYGADEYYARLDRLVLKYAGRSPAAARTCVIPNGVRSDVPQARPDGRAPRDIVVSGRIAPSKFLLEIVDALRIVWASVPDTRLHILGEAQERDLDYARRLVAAIGDDAGRRVFLHGAAFDAPQRLAQYDVALVIGHHQGCPNAVLEAMAAGLAVVANDSGGTRELVLDGRTGVLLPDRTPACIAAGLLRVLTDRRFAARLAQGGRARIERRHSMRAMAEAYRRLLQPGRS